MNPLYEFITKPFNPNNTNDNNVLMDNMLRTMEFEGGHREKAYLDSEGYPTIGVGKLLERTKYDVLPEKYKDLEWSEEEGMSTFLEDYLNMQQDVASRYGEDEFSGLPLEAQSILTDLAFNVGPSKLFTSFPGFLEDIKGGRYDEAAKELRYKNPDEGNLEESKWWGQVGGRSTEEKIASGEWAEEESRTANRATATFDILTSLMGAQNQ